LLAYLLLNHHIGHTIDHSVQIASYNSLAKPLTFQHTFSLYPKHCTHHKCLYHYYYY